MLYAISMPIHILQYVIHAQKWSCTHISFGTYLQKNPVILCTHNQWSLCKNLTKILKDVETSHVFLELSAQIYRWLVSCIYSELSSTL